MVRITAPCMAGSKLQDCRIYQAAETARCSGHLRGAETRWACVCSCAGRFHGARTPPPDLGGGLSVETEYTTETYTVWPDGRSTRGTGATR